MGVRVEEHVILGEPEQKKLVTITVDGKEIQAREGENILAALVACGIIVNRYTEKRNEPRGLFCGIGQCTDCAMIVNGKPNVRTCVTPVKAGMVIETQYGVGKKVAVND
ncbi:MAG: (2Fe-2S)-binding protein [Bacillota bacterium]|nr:(2Fe-2S)-binding protein [Bacillota bacterium]